MIAENQALGVTAFEDYLKDAATEPNGIGGGVYLTFETQAIYNTIFTGNKEDNNDVSDTQGGFPMHCIIVFRIIPIPIRKMNF